MKKQDPGMPMRSSNVDSDCFAEDLPGNRFEDQSITGDRKPIS